MIQRWFGYHLSLVADLPDHVHGFVPERSTVTAARIHCPAQWVLSIDIRDFFGSVNADRVFASLQDLGYPRAAAHLLTDLSTVNVGGSYRCLPQGAPSSPVLANLAFQETDIALEELAITGNMNLTRYADDISFSSSGRPDQALQNMVHRLVESHGWTIAQEKTRLAELPLRYPRILGLHVDQEIPRLPKKYKNRLRMMRHMIKNDDLPSSQRAKFDGHLAYAASIG